MSFAPRVKKETSGVPNGSFLRIKDGGSVTVLVLGEPHTYNAMWNGKSYVECGEDEGSFRFKVNVAVQDEDGNWVCKIWESAGYVYDNLVALSEDYDLNSTLIKVSRRGSTAQDTTYTIIPSPKQPPKAGLEKLKNIPTLKLVVKPSDIPNHAPKAKNEMPVTEEEEWNSL